MSDLATMRDALDKFFGDTGRYPASLDELVARRYLRRIPPDPITESSDSWVVVALRRTRRRLRREGRRRRKNGRWTPLQRALKQDLPISASCSRWRSSASRSQQPGMWRTAAQREREQELLFVGSQFRNAFMSYYGAAGRPAALPAHPRRPGGGQPLPGSPPPPAARLRRPDDEARPDWDLVGPWRRHRRCAQRSGEPLKTGNFSPQDVRFEGAERYSDWKFVFESRSGLPSTQRAPAK